jgi:hypothetical protein
MHQHRCPVSCLFFVLWDDGSNDAYQSAPKSVTALNVFITLTACLSSLFHFPPHSTLTLAHLLRTVGLF